MGYYEEVLELAVRILSVTPGSPAELAGILADGIILSINGEPILDEIDYQALSIEKTLDVLVRQGAEDRRFLIEKDEWEPLGLSLDETEAMKPRH